MLNLLTIYQNVTQIELDYVYNYLNIIYTQKL